MPEWSLVIHLQIPQGHVNWQPHFIQLNKCYWCVWPTVAFWSRLHWAVREFVIKWSMNSSFEGNQQNHSGPTLPLITWQPSWWHSLCKYEKAIRKCCVWRETLTRTLTGQTFSSLNIECRVAHYCLCGHCSFFWHIICKWTTYISPLSKCIYSLKSWTSLSICIFKSFFL